MRGSFYVTERLRRKQEKEFSSREDFLQSLGTEVDCFIDDDSCISRLAQLTEKTNQFNINKRPLTEEEIKGYMADDGYAVFHASAADSFGNHGIIAFALAQKGKEKWIIESLLMSCRVLGRGIEEAFFESIRRQAAKSGAGQLEILFVPSEKNEPAREFVGKYLNAHTISSSAPGLMPSWVRLHIYG
jgi:FkbH-like protein